MKFALSVLCLSAIILLAGCGAGQNGSVALAFVRSGALWRMQPDGSGLYQISAGTVLGFAWSPDHHELVGRYAATKPFPAVSPLFPNAVADVAAAQGTVSIDGGNIIEITPSSPLLARCDAWWDAQGNRLFYREDVNGEVQWYLSQPDQPQGIARKLIAADRPAPNAPNGVIFPTSAPDATQVAWVNDSGDLLLGPPGGTAQVLQHGALPQLPDHAPARPLWQPGHHAILYAVGNPAEATSVTLMLTDLSGHTRQVAQGALDGYAWSPDGTHLLTHQAGKWTIYTAAGSSVMMWNDADPMPLAWWSPDGRAVLIRSPLALTLVTLATQTRQPLVMFSAPNPAVPSQATQGLPVTGSPWSADSQQIALVADAGTWSDGTKLATKSKPGSGLYIISISSLKKAPALVDWGDHVALSWSTPDPNTQWLIP
jgi:hypothetical protein